MIHNDFSRIFVLIFQNDLSIVALTIYCPNIQQLISREVLIDHIAFEASIPVFYSHNSNMTHMRLQFHQLIAM